MAATKTTDAKPARVKVEPKAPAKPRATATPKVEAVAAAVEGASAVVASATPVRGKGGNASALKVKTLVDQVVAVSGGKKKGVKEIIDATLAAMGAALSRGESLNLPPLGKAKVSRQTEKSGAELIVVKFKRGGAGAGRNKAAKEALAAAEE